MSAFFYAQQQHQPPFHHPNAHIQPNSSSSHHGNRSRRGGIKSQNTQRQFRGVKSMRELAEAPSISAFRARFEAGRSFDLDDDLEFCPSLLTEDDFHSINSASDQSSLSSSSPSSSPLQQQIQPAQQVTPPSVSLSPGSSTNGSSSYVQPGVVGNNNVNQFSFQQPAASRTRKVIPIVNPNTGMTLSSPPTSLTPGLVQNGQRRW